MNRSRYTERVSADAYELGKNSARAANFTEADNPYRCGPHRDQWLKGFLDMRRKLVDEAAAIAATDIEEEGGHLP